jgi:hypothetical protein
MLKRCGETIMKRYFNRRLLFNAFAFAVGLMAGWGAIGGANATEYNGLSSKPVCRRTSSGKSRSTRSDHSASTCFLNRLREGGRLIPAP